MGKDYSPRWAFALGGCCLVLLPRHLALRAQVHRECEPVHECVLGSMYCLCCVHPSITHEIKD